MSSQNKFKSTVTEKKWIEYHKEKEKLQNKNSTPAIENKIEIINSLMSACKIGFNLPNAKIKKILKFFKEKEENKKIKYGTLPVDIESKTILFKEIVILYSEKDGQVFFKEK